MFRTLILCGTILSMAVPGFAQESANDLFEKANKLYEEKDYQSAEMAYRSAADRCREEIAATTTPGRLPAIQQMSWYNAACCASLTGEAAQAMELLEESVRTGLADMAYLFADADFRTVREQLPEQWDRLQMAMRQAGEEKDPAAQRLLVLLPRGADPATITRGIVVLHGGGSCAETMVPVFQPVADRLQSVVIIPRATQFSEPGQWSWNQTTLKYDEEVIEAGITEARRTALKLRDEDLSLFGYSQGGGSAFLLAAFGTRKYREVVLLGPYVQLAQRERCATAPGTMPPVHLLCGEKEEEGVRASVEILQQARQSRGFPLSVTVLPEIGHGLPPDFTDLLAARISSKSP